MDIESPETPAKEKTVIRPEADDTEGDIFLECLCLLIFSLCFCGWLCFCVCVRVYVRVYAIPPSLLQQWFSNWSLETARVCVFVQYGGYSMLRQMVFVHVPAELVVA